MAREIRNRPPEKLEPQSSGPDHGDNRPIPRSLREAGGTDAEKAGPVEQKVNIGNSGKRDHNL